MVNNSEDYPLNCIEETGDGFSGWFAISKTKQCNDFCYWNLPPSMDNSTSSIYTSLNTANPHRTTVIDTTDGKVYWVCIFDSAEDKQTISSVKEERWIESNYATLLKTQDNKDDAIFPYLRCQKGAGEQLTTWSEEFVKSTIFWESCISLSSLILAAEITALVMFCKKRRRIRYEQVVGLEESPSTTNHDSNDGLDSVTDGISSLQIDDEDDDNDDNTRLPFNQEQQIAAHMNSTTRCKYCTLLTSKRAIHIIQILLVLILNVLLLFTITFSSISLMEISASPYFTEGMEKLTPACSDPSLVCPAGNVDIDRDSVQWPQIEKNKVDDVNTATTRASKTTSNSSEHQEMKPFSYIIASDAQLYWFNGEFAAMGDKSIPPACSLSDSCWRCTGKHGLYTNQRMKNAWESIMIGKTMNATNSSSDLPIPSTLIMNGDLTAYFHPYEKQAYDSIYSNINGLKYYFPSLGNHDIAHPGGAMYGGDEWLGGGPPNCNMEHALGYFKSAFCGHIPTFDTNRIVRYDSSSLAYSWEEGRYHFVHSHYYPSYEMASIKYHSSLEWLERDLQKAHDAGLATILFVHAAQGLNDALENIILGKNVKAIIAGHTHRCLHRKCEGVFPLNEDQVKNLDTLGIEAKKCIPAAYDVCEVLPAENLVYTEDLADGVTFPNKKLKNRERKDKPLCPKPSPSWINETDNSLLCHRVVYSHPNFPFGSEKNATTDESIPIFWSGSSSFETFLRGDFYDDHFVINSMTVSLEGELVRFVDLHTLPNAVYPYHTSDDMEETIVRVD